MYFTYISFISGLKGNVIFVKLSKIICTYIDEKLIGKSIGHQTNFSGIDLTGNLLIKLYCCVMESVTTKHGQPCKKSTFQQSIVTSHLK